MNNLIRFGMALLTTTLCYGDLAQGADNAELEARNFVQAFEAKLKPLAIESGRLLFDAVTSGDPALYERSSVASLALKALYSDRSDFATVKRLRESVKITDPELKRMLDIMYLGFLGNQIDPNLMHEITDRETALERKFNTYRVKVGERELNDNQVDSILRHSTNSAELEAVWKASRNIGSEIQAQVVELTNLRNQTARSLGFANFFEMQLKLGEQEPTEIIALFDQLDSLTREPFAALKEQIDSALTMMYGISKEQILPWHYQNRFFQEAPHIYDVDLNSYYQGKDPVEISRRYYAGIGLPVDSILAHSDLYERPGKYQHAQCMDIDREGDVRIICNVRPDYYWTNTMLHELGHAVYDYYYEPNQTWLLRGAAHSLTTEAIANFFGRLASNSDWLAGEVGIPKAEAERAAAECRKTLRLEQLVFGRWAQVVVRFEREMYTNPDQDLNSLWYNLVEKYQNLPRIEGRDEPDWAAKIHIALYPCYYHNYVLGELLASQFAAKIAKDVVNTNDPSGGGFCENTAIGRYFIENVFHPGSRYRWDEMIERATGEKLTPKYYARQFVEGSR